MTDKSLRENFLQVDVSLAKYSPKTSLAKYSPKTISMFGLLNLAIVWGDL